MDFIKDKRGFMEGLGLVILFAGLSYAISYLPVFKSLSLSPMIIGILVGMFFSNLFHGLYKETYFPAIAFCTKRILRLGIILYGFRLTLSNIFEVGPVTILIDATVVTFTIILGVLFGRLLKMDRGIALLIGVGSAICGAAAVLGAESALRTKPYKTAVAVATVVIFGTISMFLYPTLYHSGIVDLSEKAMGIYTGSTLHEVAHVVGAGNAMSEEIASNAIIVKMIRVLMLVPVLLILSYLVTRKQESFDEDKGKISIPWFALLFLVVILINSCLNLDTRTLLFINHSDTFLLTMAMTALGMDTNFGKFKKAGLKPFLLAAMLYVFLIFGGYTMARIADGLFI